MRHLILILAISLGLTSSSSAGSVPDTTWKPAMIVYQNEYGQYSAKWIRGTAASTPENPTVSAGSNQTITLPTSGTTLTGTASSPNAGGFITATLWSVVSKPTGATPAITDDDNLTTTVTGLSLEGNYVFSLTATDNLGLTSSDDMQVTVNPEPSEAEFTIGDRMLVDLGGDTDAVGRNLGGSSTISPQGDGRYWNTLGAPIFLDDGSAFRNANYTSFVDTAGNEIAGIEIGSGGSPYNFFHNDTTGGVNTTGGNPSGVGIYPASATVDSWIAQNTTTQSDGQIIITLPAGTYAIKFWGARASGGTLTSSLTYGGTTKSYNASNNSNFDNAAVFTVTSDGTTPLIFDISSAGSSNNFGYFGIIDIKRTL